MSPIPSRFILGLAVFLMGMALFCQNITIAAGSYFTVLMTALVLMALADVLCFVVYRRGGPVRLAAVLVAAPSVFILLDSTVRLAAMIVL